MSNYGKKFKIELLGTSHGPEISVAIKGIPEGFEIDEYALNEFLKRRSARGNDLATARKELDEIVWKNGVYHENNGMLKVVGKVVKAAIKNEDVISSDYDRYKVVPRPGHADFAAIMKDGENVEIEGGGRFSGRLTVGLCVAGGIAKQILEKEGITIETKIKEIGGSTYVSDFEEIIYDAREEGDSVGGIVECQVKGLQPGSCGDSYFDGLEGKISEAIFAVPAVKGVEFGAGFNAAKMMGSENNDAYSYDDQGNIVTITNNHGGILGGIATGMPVVVRAAFKPTPSISKVQQSVNLITGENESIRVEGRHDPCIVPRGAVCIEAATAIAILDALMESRDFSSKFEEARAIIDEQNDIILEAFEKRMKAAETIGHIKAEKGLDIYDPIREAEILQGVERASDPKFAEYATELFDKLLELSRNLQEKGINNAADYSVPGDLIPELARRRGLNSLTGVPLKTGLLGRKLEHSYSPEIHELIANYANLDYSYWLYEVEPEDLERFIEARNFDALNVTIPYKQAVIPYLDELTEAAAAIGAVNTIINRDEKLIGDNTDFDGLVYTLKKYNAPIEGANCLVLGTGGGAKAVKAALLYLGAKKVNALTHADIDSGRANEFIDCNVVVNSTPVGMYPFMDDSPIDPGKFINLEFLMDIIYNPMRTKLLIDAKASGIKAVSGLDMLVAQAVKSAEKFFAVELEDDLVDVILHDITIQKQNIVIIGMPGSGKTSLGKELASMLGKAFYDTDEMVEYRTGKSPKEIILYEGEERFREYESDACSVLSDVSGAVISTGGGIISRTENYMNLAKNGLIVFIEKGMDSLAIKDRPISEKLGLEKLYLERLPKYEKWADVRVNIDGLSLEDACDKIIKAI